jgi:hypothetical protein
MLHSDAWAMPQQTAGANHEFYCMLVMPRSGTVCRGQLSAMELPARRFVTSVLLWLAASGLALPAAGQTVELARRACCDRHQLQRVLLWLLLW